MPLPAFLKPVNILDPGADEEIKRMGELARAIVTFDLFCNEHGQIAWNVPEGDLQLKEDQHRAGEACYHKMEIR